MMIDDDELLSFDSVLKFIGAVTLLYLGLSIVANKLKRIFQERKNAESFGDLEDDFQDLKKYDRDEIDRFLRNEG